MRRKWIQDPVTHKMVEVGTNHQVSSRKTASIQGDIQPFVSSVDGTVIGSRRTLREHNRRNGVIQASEWGNKEFCNTDAKREREQKILGTNKKYNEQRKRDVIDAVNRHS